MFSLTVFLGFCLKKRFLLIINNEMLTLIGWNDNLANFPTLNTRVWSWNVCWPEHNLRMSCRFVLDLLELLSGKVWWTVPWKGSCWCEIQRYFCRLTLIWSYILVGSLVRKKHCRDINDEFVFSSCWHSLKFHSNKVGKDHVRIVGIGFGISMEGIASLIKGLPVRRSFDCTPFWLRLFWNINYSNLASFQIAGIISYNDLHQMMTMNLDLNKFNLNCKPQIKKNN